MKKFDSFLMIMAMSVLITVSCSKEEPVSKKEILSFEEISLNDQGIYNGSDGSGGFTSGNAIFKTSYNSQYQSWSGFSVSNHTDTLTPDYSNQYSSIAGKGAANSQKYLVLYSFSADTIEFIKPALVTNIAFTNTTYTWFTIRDGNMFSKKFGGETGKDPDYFYLRMKAVDSTGTDMTFNPLPLADYTSSSDSLDYIVKEWNYYNLSSVGKIKYLIFSFESSDTSVYGINTPTYVCIDYLVNEYEE